MTQFLTNSLLVQNLKTVFLICPETVVLFFDYLQETFQDFFVLFHLLGHLQVMFQLGDLLCAFLETLMDL